MTSVRHSNKIGLIAGISPRSNTSGLAGCAFGCLASRVLRTSGVRSRIPPLLYSVMREMAACMLHAHTTHTNTHEHSHTRTYAYTHALHTHALKKSRTLTHRQVHTYKNKQTHAETHTQKHSHVRTLTRTKALTHCHTHAQTYTQIFTHTFTHIHTYTRTHTHTYGWIQKTVLPQFCL